MKRKTNTRKKLNYEEALNIAAKEEIAFFGQCSKFKPTSVDPAPIDRAIHFLFLKENNVDRKTALSFGQRRLCKIDSTRQFDGPATSRIMKTTKLLSGAINGWHNGAHDPKYELGPGYTTDIKINNSFQLTNNPIDERVQTSERDRATYQKYQFSKLPPERLTQELCKLKEENQINYNKYLQVDGLKLFHLLQQEHSKPSILQEFEAFSTIENVAHSKFLQQKSVSNLYEFSNQRLRQRALTNLHDFKKPIKPDKQRLSIQPQNEHQKVYKKLLYQLNVDEPKQSKSKQSFSKEPSQQQIEHSSRSRGNSQISLFFNLTNRQTLPSNTSISQQSQKKLLVPKRHSQADNFQEKVEAFVKQRLQLYNSKSHSPEVDCTNLQKSQDRYRQFQQKEFKRIQKNTCIGILHSQR